jgi:undecaprenyl phosphate-alpha-L-ara4N flippase subunit ArnF
MSARGVLYALASVALVSAAQLAMRWSMTRLPRIELLPAAVGGGAYDLLAVAVLLLGIAGYGASLLCWLAALGHLPLNRAYSLLSLSYALVYLCAALLPGLGGSFSTGKTCGVALVVLGVVLINARRALPGATPG